MPELSRLPQRLSSSITLPEPQIASVVHGKKRRALLPVRALVGIGPVVGLYAHPEDPGLCLLGDRPGAGGGDVLEKARALAQCPWGSVGSDVWLRESWAPRTFGLLSGLDTLLRPRYKADHALDGVSLGDWRAPNSMPKWASRLTLKLTLIELVSIAELGWEDAVSEGMDPSSDLLPLDYLQFGWQETHRERIEPGQLIWRLSFSVTASHRRR